MFGAKFYVNRSCRGLCQAVDSDYGGCCGLCNNELSENQPLYDQYKRQILKTNKSAWNDIADFEVNSAVSTKKIYEIRRAKLEASGSKIIPPSDFFAIDYDKRKLLSLVNNEKFELLPELELISGIRQSNIESLVVFIKENKAESINILDLINAYQINADKGCSQDYSSMIPIREYANTYLEMKIGEGDKDALPFLDVVKKHTCDRLRKLNYNDDKFSSILSSGKWDSSLFDVNLEMPELIDYKILIDDARSKYEISLSKMLKNESDSMSIRNDLCQTQNIKIKQIRT